MLDVARQRDDYRTVLRWAADQPAVDPDRIFAWGTSFAGMHIVELAASEQRTARVALSQE
jgi:dienelactone hydrolase